jgi:hypothetical protein
MQKRVLQNLSMKDDSVQETKPTSTRRLLCERILYSLYPNAVQEGQCGREMLCHRPFRRTAGTLAYGTTLIDSSNGEFASAAEETAQIIGGIEKMWILAGRSRIEGSNPWCHQCQSRDSPTISPHHVPGLQSGAEISRYNLAERRRTMPAIQTQDVSHFAHNQP